MDVARVMSQRAIEDFAATRADKGSYGALVAFACRKKFHLCELAVQDFQPEFKTADMWFSTMGSGQLIADPFLAFIKRVLFGHSRPKLHEGVFATYWTLEQAIELNAGGIQGPAQIATLSLNQDQQFRAAILTAEDLLEHQGNKRGIEECLREYRDKLGGKLPLATEPTPDPPIAPVSKL
jgi:hypothetical protein